MFNKKTKIVKTSHCTIKIRESEEKEQQNQIISKSLTNDMFEKRESLVTDGHLTPCPIQDNKSIEEYTKKEAKQMFEWFVNTVDERVEHLFNIINQVTTIPLAYNYDTFIKVLEWYFSIIKIRYYTPTEMMIRKVESPEIVRDSLSTYEFTDLTYTIMSYVGTYLGKVIQYNAPGSIWKLDTCKSSFNYNRPYLEKKNGLGSYPLTNIEVLSRKYIEKKPLNLEKAFKNWIDCGK